MDINKINTLRNSISITGSPSTTELDYIARQVAAEQPKIFCEFGVASGMSSAIIAHCMAENNGEALHSFDISKYYYADPTKETGFCIPHIFKDDKKLIHLHTEKTAFDLSEFFEIQSVDMAFIDANHCHPWPTIDTMLLLPFMRPGAKILYHDISLYLSEEWKNGIGPKHLFDQFVRGQKHIIHEENPGIGYIYAPLKDYHDYTDQLCTSLLQPWTIQISQQSCEKFCDFLSVYYGKIALTTFKSAMRLFNTSEPVIGIVQKTQIENEKHVHTLLKDGKTQEALEAANNIYNMFPNEGWTLILRSFAQVALGQNVAALKSAKDAYELSPVAWGYRYLRLLGENNKWDEVKEIAEKILDARPNISYPYRHLAYAAEANGTPDAALKYLYKALSIDPNDKWAKEDIMRLQNV